MRIRVKVCGVTSADAAVDAANCGVDAVGFVFAPSVRRVTPEAAKDIAALLPPFVSRVAVFLHPSPIEILEVLKVFPADVVQVEPQDAILQALPAHIRLLAVLHDGPGVVEEASALRKTLGERCAILLDPPDRGGRGFPIDRAHAYDIARGGPLVLAGGLAPDTVGEAIRRVRPWAVDVSSGVEWLPGVKNRLRIQAFVVAVRFAEAELNRLEGNP
jgi:phosphoribosylanthranilate isomerase